MAFDSVENGADDRVRTELGDDPLDSGRWRRSGTDDEKHGTRETRHELRVRQEADRRCVDQYPIESVDPLAEQRTHTRRAQSSQWSWPRLARREDAESIRY